MVLAQAASSTKLYPIPPFKLFIVFPVYVFTTSPVVSWSEIVNIEGIPFITEKFIGFGFLVVLFPNSSISIATPLLLLETTIDLLPDSNSLMALTSASTLSLLGVVSSSVFNLKSTFPSGWFKIVSRSVT